MDAQDSPAICAVVEGDPRAMVPMQDYDNLHRATTRIEAVLVEVIASIDRLSTAVDNAPNATAEEKLKLFRTAYRDMIKAFDTLSDKEQAQLIAPTAPAPLEGP